MALWQGKSKRKITGGRRRYARGKRKFEIGREQQFAIIGAHRRKLYKVRGGRSKVRILQAEHANLVDTKTGKVTRVPLKTVLSNEANINYVQRNILTKGAIVDTELGPARITSRPGQSGVVNAILIKE
ncbi:MAG TPA: 30S ribosomal protein S8e [Euryarchaeota archaeon]|nr:30S ribosomal protein S8e [Euryarchaeota archaeon]